MYINFVVSVFYVQIILIVSPVSAFIGWSAENRIDLLNDLIDPNINPCVDFYQHACANFSEQSNLMTKMKDAIKDKLFDKITESLESDEILTRFDSLVIKFLIRLLIHCNNLIRASESLAIYRNLRTILRFTPSQRWPLPQDDLDSFRNASTSINMMTEEELGALHGLFLSKTSESLILSIETNYPKQPIGNTQNEPYFKICLNHDSIEGQNISASEINEVLQNIYFFEVQLVIDNDVEIQNLNSFINYLTKFKNKQQNLRQVAFGSKLAQISELNNLTGNTFRWERFLNAYTAAIGFPELAHFSAQSWIEYKNVGILREFAMQLRKRFSPITIKNFIGLRFIESQQHFLFNQNINCNEILGPNEIGLIFPWIRLFFDYIFPAERFELRQILDDSRNFINAELMRSIKWQYELLLNQSKLFGDKSTPILREKLSAMGVHVAYPDWLFNDTGLDQWYRMDVAIANKPKIRALLNARHVNAFSPLIDIVIEWREHILQTEYIKIWTNRYSWSSDSDLLSTQAEYIYLQNKIEVKLGFLLPPFYGIEYPLSLIYGVVGMTLAHEMTHAFDPVGKNFNASGYLDKCLSIRDRRKYNVRCAMLLATYNTLRESITDTRLNAKGSQIEDIADHGAIRVAFAAMQSHRSRNFGMEGWSRRYSHLTHEQLFFYAWAQTHCENVPDQEIMDRMNSGPHSPATVRTNVLLQNFDPFATAFNCTIGSPMNPENKFMFW